METRRGSGPKTTINIDPDLRKRVKIAAVIDGTTLSGIVRSAFETYLTDREGGGSDREQAAYTAGIEEGIRRERERLLRAVTMSSVGAGLPVSPPARRK